MRRADELKIKVERRTWPVEASAGHAAAHVLANESAERARFGAGWRNAARASVLADGVEIRSCVTRCGGRDKSAHHARGLAAL